MAGYFDNERLHEEMLEKFAKAEYREHIAMTEGVSPKKNLPISRPSRKWQAEIEALPRYIDPDSPLGRDLISQIEKRKLIMAYEQKNMNGSLFKNDKKTADNQPDYRGSCMIDGVEYWQSAWIKESANGQKYMSFAYSPKEEKPAAAPVDDNPF
jgi:hypothetical protein